MCLLWGQGMNLRLMLAKRDHQRSGSWHTLWPAPTKKRLWCEPPLNSRDGQTNAVMPLFCLFAFMVRWMISFLAFQGNAEHRHMVINQIAHFASQGLLSNDPKDAGQRMGLVEALSGGKNDLAAAHRNSGFTVALLVIGEAIFHGLPIEEAPNFVLDLVKAATADADIGPVPWQFLKWMFEEAVVEIGPSRIRSTALEAGQMFKVLADPPNPPSKQQRKAKMLVAKARQRGMYLAGAEEMLVAKAVGAALDRAGEHAGHAVYWIAELYDHPIDRYRHFARKLLYLVENA